MADQSTDHDILITLVESVKNNNANVVEKLEGLKQKIGESTSIVGMQVKDHETRLQGIEHIMLEIQPKAAYAEFLIIKEQFNNFKFSWKIIVGIAASVGGMVGFIISVLLGVLNLLNAFHH